MRTRLGNFESVPNLCEARLRNVARGPVPRATLLHAREFRFAAVVFFHNGGFFVARLFLLHCLAFFGEF